MTQAFHSSQTACPVGYVIRLENGVTIYHGSFPVLEQDARRFIELARQEAPKVEVIVLEPGQEYILE